MIFEFLINAVLGLISLLVGALPNASTFPIDPTGIASLFGTVGQFDSALPIHETVAMLGLYLAARVALMQYGVARALVRWLPSWISGGG